MSVARAESKSDASSESRKTSTPSEGATRRNDASRPRSGQGQGRLRRGGPAVELRSERSATHELGNQAKLTVNEPGDKYEKEAERVADTVMRMPEPKDGVDTEEHVPVDRIQRMCPRCQRRFQEGKPLNCEDCEQELQRKETSVDPPTVDEKIQQQIRSLRDGGHPLSKSVRSFFEPRFGEDFSNVRMHTGRRADQVARSLNAEAFTVGQDVAFRSGAYRPDMNDGKQLLAHELTHIVHQRNRGTASGEVARQPDDGSAAGAAGAVPNLPSVSNVDFNNAGNSSGCCAVCPISLGVGVNGGARNGMEMQFDIDDHRPGFEYDILRTRRNSLWERRGGDWHSVESQPMGTNDDHHQDDECQDAQNGRVSVVDNPGNNANLPRPDGHRYIGLTGASTNPNATEVVFRYSFAEWVSTRNRAEGISPQRITPFYAWHSITWLTRNAANQWVLDNARSEIERGSIDVASEPTP